MALKYFICYPSIFIEIDDIPAEIWNQAEERQKFFKYSVDEKSDKGESYMFR